MKFPWLDVVFYMFGILGALLTLYVTTAALAAATSAQNMVFSVVYGTLSCLLVVLSTLYLISVVYDFYKGRNASW